MSLFDVFVTGFQRGNSWDTHTSQRIGGFLTREEAEQNAKHLIDEHRLFHPDDDNYDVHFDEYDDF